METNTSTHWIPIVITLLNAFGLVYVTFWRIPWQVREIRIAVLNSIPEELKSMRAEVMSLKEAQSAQRFPTNEQTLAIMELGIERAKFNLLSKIPDIIRETKDQPVDKARIILQHIGWSATSYTRDRWDKFYDKKLGNIRIFFKDKMNTIMGEAIEEILKILPETYDDTRKAKELEVLIERAAHKAAYETLTVLGNY